MSVTTPTMDQSLARLRASLHRILSISDDEWASFAPVVRSKAFARNQDLIRTGEVCTQVSFIISGCVRFYSVTEQGNEAVNGFALENEFVASMNTLVDGVPSYFSIEALESTQVLQFDWPKVKDSDYFNQLREAISHDLFKALERRQQEFIACTPEERYVRFLERSAQINKRVADRHIASFLGITPVHLSRIRKKLKETADP